MRDLVIALVSREVKVAYKRSVLGILWTLITPLFQLLSYSILFCGVLGVRESHYASIAFTGLLSWNWFQTSLLNGSRCITGNGNYLMNSQFPIAVLPPVVVTTGLIHFVFALPALFFMFLVSGVSIGPTALLLPVVVLVQLAMTIALVYPFAAVNVKFRDLQHILQVLLQMAFILTPIFYSIDKVPPHLKWIWMLNPMTHMIEAYRAILLRGTQPDWLALAVILLASATLLPIGYWLFKRQRFKFAEEI